MDHVCVPVGPVLIVPQGALAAGLMAPGAVAVRGELRIEKEGEPARAWTNQLRSVEGKRREDSIDLCGAVSTY